MEWCLLNKEIPEYMYSKYDFIFKRVFGYEGNEDITKDLVESIIGEKIKKLEFKNPFLLRETKKDKEEVLDIKAVLNNNTLCDIEIQVGNEHDFDKRILDYWAKMYRTSIGRKLKYINMKRAIVIFIAAFDIDNFEKIESYRTRWKILEEKIKIPLTNVFQLDIIELSKAERYFKNNKIQRNNIAESWIKFLINPIEVEESKMEEMNDEIKKAYEIWKNLQEDDETKDAAERRMRELASNEAAKEYEYKLGKKEGKKEEKMNIAKKLLEIGINVNDIEKCTGLTKKDIESLAQNVDRNYLIDGTKGQFGMMRKNIYTL